MVLSADGIMGPYIPTPEAAEMKPYTFRYSVLPHEEGWRESTTYRHAMEFNMPLIAIHLGGREALQLITLEYDSDKVRSEGYHLSFLEIEPKNVVLSTLKLGEHNVDSGGDPSLVVRIYETEGIDENEVRLIFFKKIKSASIIDLLENQIQEIPTLQSDTREKNDSMSEAFFNDNTIMISIGAFKIVSLRVNF